MAVDASEAAPLPEEEREPLCAHRGEALVESYRRLAHVFHDVLSEQSLEALLERIADTLAELIPYDALHVYEADESRRELVPVLARSRWQDELLSVNVPFGEGITGWSVEQLTPVLSNSAQLDPRIEVLPWTPPGPEALITVPLVARGSLKGALDVYRIGAEAAFEDEEFELAKWFGDAAALAIDNAQVKARLEYLAQTDPLTGLYNHRTFHERLRAELARAVGAGHEVALLMIDIDDFKRVNDVCGHAAGDELLQRVAGVLRATVRGSDVVCRIGGEEFAIVLPAGGVDHALGLAARLERGLAELDDQVLGQTTVSTGIATGPPHATSARELVACAEAAMMTAKAQGKNRVSVFAEATVERPEGPDGDRGVRSIAHLKLLQSLSRRLNRLNDVASIADAIVDELRSFVDYHACGVYLVDGAVLEPIAFRGEVGPWGGLDRSLLRLELGEGLTGRVIESGRPLLVDNVLESDLTHPVPGQAELEMSVVAVPLRWAGRVTGAVVLSKLGVGQFDADDLRLLEVLSGHASVALENAQLYDSLRREAENANACLEFSDAVADKTSIVDIGDETTATVARLLGVERASLWLEDRDTGFFRRTACTGREEFDGSRRSRDRTGRAGVAHMLDGRKSPFVLTSPEVRRHFYDDDAYIVPSAGVLAPLHPGFGVRGFIALRAPAIGLAHFTDERLRLLEALAYRAAVALQKASLFRAQQESAETANALLEFGRWVAAAAARDDVLTRIPLIAGQVLNQRGVSLWRQTEVPGEFEREGMWSRDGAPAGSGVGRRIAIPDQMPILERLEPYVMSQVAVGEVDETKVDVPFAVAPFSVEGRIWCLVVACDEVPSEQQLRLIAGMAHQTRLVISAR